MDFLETHQLLAFRMVAELGSFTKAARRLNLTQSALSHKIKTLESQLNTEVFIRIGKRVLLTPSGEVLLKHAVTILEHLEEARRAMYEISAPDRGRLRINAASYTCYHLLPYLLREFRLHYPRVELTIAGEYTGKAVQWLLNGELDLGIFVLPPTIKGLHIERLCQDELVVIVAPEHPWATRTCILWSDFSDQVLITYNKLSQTHQYVQSQLTRSGGSVREVMEVQLAEAVSAMVKVGLGVAIIPRWVVQDDLQHGTLVALSLGKNGVKRWWVLASVKGRKFPPYGEAFIQLCRELFPTLMATGGHV